MIRRLQQTVLSRWLGQVFHRWLSLSRWEKAFSIGILCLLTLVGVLSFFLGTGGAAALQARDRFDEVEAKLVHLSPVDLLEAGLYQSLTVQFRDAEQSAGRARSRLRLLGLFTWLPGIGERINDSLTQLEMAYFMARGGHSLANAYATTLEPSLKQLDGDVASQRITEALQRNLPLLLQADGDIVQAHQLLRQLGDGRLNPRYTVLIDTYMPQIQAVVYISRASPQAIGHTYVLGRELIAVGDLVDDPLKVLSDPTQVKQSLAIIVDHSQRLAEALEEVERTFGANTPESAPEWRKLLPVIQLMKQGATLLKHVTGVPQGLLALGAVLEEQGLLGRNFGAAAGPALKEAEANLVLAREEAARFRALLPRQGRKDIVPSLFLSPGSGTENSLGSIDRLEALLGQALDSVRFLQYFLGFQGPRTYLVLAQNQQEIRATGGFIGVALRVTLDQGDLVDMVYRDSHYIDAPGYVHNPPAPAPLYWYLWMDRMLFRDANWSPHFPASATRIAELYRLGQGVEVDGVITVTKQLMVDMTGLLGDIRVPDLRESLTRETAAAYIDGQLPYPCSSAHIAGQAKRCFDQDLVFALKNRLTSQTTPEERIAITQLLKAAIDRGNILIHVFSPEKGRIIEELGWNGAIPLVDQDYLLVVDSNLPGHVAKEIWREWDYQISLQLSKPATSRLRVRYHHIGSPREDKVCRQSIPESSNCYWNYFRIYFPGTATGITFLPVPLHGGSEKFIWGYQDPESGSLTRASDIGPAQLMEMGGFIVVAPDSVTTVPLEYRLPWEIVRRREDGLLEYRLLVQKQPGMDRDQVSVSVELPPRTKLLATSPAPKTRNGRWVIFDFPLDSDKEVVVAFKSSSR